MRWYGLVVLMASAAQQVVPSAAAQAQPAAAPAAAPAFDAQARVSEALAAVRPVAFTAPAADWVAIERRARALAAEARDSVDLLPAYAAITFGLHDGHSFVEPTAEQREGWVTRHGQRRLLPDEPPRPRAESALSARTDIASRAVPLGRGRIAGLVVVPAVRWAEGNVSPPYGNNLWRNVAELAGRRGLCGFVVDLRGNTGGDVWPMVNGLAPLLGDGHRFATVDNRHRQSVQARLQGRAVVPVPPDAAQPVLNRLEQWRPLPKLAVMPVAVLIDRGTASSGEAVALAFRARPRTRFFGARTFGLASSNEMLTLSDGTRLFVTTALGVDAAGKSYPAGIDPGEATGPPASDDGPDPTEAAAAAWLAKQPCR